MCNQSGRWLPYEDKYCSIFHDCPQKSEDSFNERTIRLIRALFANIQQIKENLEKLANSDKTQQQDIQKIKDHLGIK